MTPEHMTMLRSEKTVMLGEELNPVRKANLPSLYFGSMEMYGNDLEADA